jgi:hypothetical protein
LSTQISREEAAVISAAILAYFGKHAPMIVHAPVKISREDIKEILDEFGKELTEKILREFKDTIGKLERRLIEVEKRIGLLRSRVDELEKVVLGKGFSKVEVEKFRFLWGLASRHEAGSRRELIQSLSKSSSFWGLISKVEKQLSYPHIRRKRLS